MRTSARGTYAFVQLTNGRAREIVDLLGTVPTVESVEALKGPYQLVVRLADDDASPIRRLDGVARVVTLGPAARPLRNPGGRSASRRRRVNLRVPQPCGTPA